MQEIRTHFDPSELLTYGSFSGQSRPQSPAMGDSVTAVEKVVKAEREKTALLEQRLAEAEKQLEAARASRIESAAEIDTLRNQLSVATRNGMSLPL